MEETKNNVLSFRRFCNLSCLCENCEKKKAFDDAHREEIKHALENSVFTFSFKEVEKGE